MQRTIEDATFSPPATIDAARPVLALRGPTIPPSGGCCCEWRHKRMTIHRYDLRGKG